MTVLVADVGGTNARIGLAAVSGNHVTLSHVEVVSTQSVADFAQVVAEHWQKLGSPPLTAAAVCAAGPVDGEGDAATVELTNAGLTVAAGPLATALKLTHAIVVNDWAAIAAAVPGLQAEDLIAHGKTPLKTDGTVVALGPGTGLGVSARIKGGTLVVGEGGHVRLAPPNEKCAALWSRLADADGFVAAEHVLSGNGLHALYLVIAKDRGERPHAEDAAAVWTAAQSGQPAAREAVRHFTTALGAYAGDLALIFNADSVLLGGGILPRWGRDFDVQTFRNAFAAKEPHYRERLSRVPSATIVHPYPGLVGLGLLAAASAG
jgi:glucokinase